jgi:hypothetical protein
MKGGLSKVTCVPLFKRFYIGVHWHFCLSDFKSIWLPAATSKHVQIVFVVKVVPADLTSQTRTKKIIHSLPSHELAAQQAIFHLKAAHTSSFQQRF